MMNLQHEAWPDMNGISEEVRRVDVELTEALGAVTLKRPDQIRPREFDALGVAGSFNTPDEASIAVGMSKRTFQSHLQMITLQLRGDNQDIPHFHTDTASLVYVVRHEGIVPYPKDNGWNESLTHAQALTLKAVALGMSEDETRRLVPSAPTDWWPRYGRSALRTKFVIPEEARLERIVGRAYEVGLFVSKNALREPKKEGGAV